MKRLVLFTAVLVLTACGPSKNEKIMTAAKVYVDNIVIEEKYSDKPDTIKILRDKVFDKYKISKDEYKKLFDNLAIDQDKWDMFFTAAEKYLDSLKTQNRLN